MTKSIKREVLISVEEGVCLAEMSLEDMLNQHRWKLDRRHNDRVLDVAIKCFKNNKSIRAIRDKISRLRKDERIVGQFENFEKEYAWVEKDLAELAGVIGKE